MVNANANIAVMIAKIIFPFIALNFKYFSKVGIKFDKLTIDTTEISLFKNNIPNLCYEVTPKSWTD